MKKNLYLTVIFLLVFAFLLSGCEGVNVTGSTSTSSSETTELTDIDGAGLSFELCDNLTLEFDPAEKTSPETAYTVRARVYQYDYYEFKSAFGLENSEITAKEEDFNVAFDHYFGVDSQYYYAYNIQVFGEERSQLGYLRFYRYLIDGQIDRSPVDSVGYYPYLIRGIEPYKGEKALEGIDLNSTKHKFEEYLNLFNTGAEAPVELENVYSLSKKEHGEFLISPLNYHRLSSLTENGDIVYISELPEEYQNRIADMYLFEWRQYINGIPVVNTNWSGRFVNSSVNLVSQRIIGYENSAGEFGFEVDKIFYDVEFEESRAVVPFETALKKVNDILSLSLTDTKYSIFKAELCYCGYKTDTFEVYFHPMWVIAVDEYSEDTELWDSFSKNFYAVDAFTGEIVQTPDIPVLN